MTATQLRRLPQPWEGVRELGVDRDDWLLSLDERAFPHRDALAAVALWLERATLVGDPAPIVSDMRRRITDPQPGDLVVYDYGATRKTAEERVTGMGVLLVLRDEWLHTDGEWLAEDPDDPYGSAFAQWTHGEPLVYDPLRHPQRPVEHGVVYIQRGPAAADVTRWDDARFITVPTWLGPRWQDETTREGALGHG